MHRAARVFLTSSTRSLEAQNGLSALLVGLFLLLPLDTFSSASGYRAFALLAGETVWGSVFAALGTLQILAVVRDHVILRRLSCGLLFALFLTYVFGIAAGNPLSAAIPFVTPMAVGQLWGFWQARRVQ